MTRPLARNLVSAAAGYATLDTPGDRAQGFASYLSARLAIGVALTAEETQVLSLALAWALDGGPRPVTLLPYAAPTAADAVLASYLQTVATTHAFAAIAEVTP